MDDFASTALFNLIAVELRKQGLDVSINAQFEGKTSGSAKRELLAVAIAKLGQSAVLRIGQGIRNHPFHPVLAVLKKPVIRLTCYNAGSDSRVTTTVIIG